MTQPRATGKKWAQSFFFKDWHYCMCLYSWVYVYTYDLSIQEKAEVQIGYCGPWMRSFTGSFHQFHRWLWAAIWLLGTECGSSATPVSSFNGWAICPTHTLISYDRKALTALRGKMIPIQIECILSWVCVWTHMSPLKEQGGRKDRKILQMLVRKENGFRKSRNTLELAYEEDL